MTKDQIKHMVDRFLSWKLPENFRPDAGISFRAEYNENTPHPMKHEPSGTNLLDAVQAEAMVRHMIEGLTTAAPEVLEALLQCEDYFDNKADADCDQDGFIPNKEMVLLSKVREAISSVEGHTAPTGNSHVHPVFQSVLATIAPPAKPESGKL
ncbi:hypothetical protein [Rhizobium sp. N122]|uniref:hypothetical protein n=1 Tax=Rhizobium sp. N122 TaxID=1764272 RepID=UPI00167E3C58|nr:hypothetical protein [Rhizobium sp. N122]